MINKAICPPEVSDIQTAHIFKISEFNTSNNHFFLKK